ncbi:hypothetical protein [Gordonia phthalatica]|uniref:Uncharacterized protein n=1 Tax=Gordonia phthalatica TaxID=1136941 RepID=A0A0N9NDF0_9ACTN|nr:hypothetical protein [Gordonia phthalatica]ALG85701.1 hypothetical protein ACH46_15950 [Gordonia phthalatica]
MLLQIPGLCVTRFTDPRWRGEDEESIRASTELGLGWMMTAISVTALVGVVAWHYSGGLTVGVIGALTAPLALIFALVGIFTLNPDREVTSSIWVPLLLATLTVGAGAARAGIRRWWGGESV